MQNKTTLLITAGPTQEPIDDVRYIGNRSSGRLGLALTEIAVSYGHNVILLLGPVGLSNDSATDIISRSCSNSTANDGIAGTLDIHRFKTTADLECLLNKFWPEHADVLIMAAAVADYRPEKTKSEYQNMPKIKRQAGGITIKLETTPDLVAACCKKTKSGQKVIGFALEPKENIQNNAINKLKKKNLNAIVANPIETMDSSEIDATLIWSKGNIDKPGKLSKIEFAKWLIKMVI